MAPEETIEVVLKKHTDDLMAMPGIVGTAEGLCGETPCIKIYVAVLTDELARKIPEQIGGHPVDIEVTGEFRALPEK